MSRDPLDAAPLGACPVLRHSDASRTPHGSSAQLSRMCSNMSARACANDALRSGSSSSSMSRWWRVACSISAAFVFARLRRPLAAGAALIAVARDLLDGFRDRVLRLRRLALDHHHRQAVQERHDVWSGVVLGPGDADLPRGLPLGPHGILQIVHQARDPRRPVARRRRAPDVAQIRKRIQGRL